MLGHPSPSQTQLSNPEREREREREREGNRERHVNSHGNPFQCTQIAVGLGWF